jgi:chemotaxis protein methyltransferase CheR
MQAKTSNESIDLLVRRRLRELRGQRGMTLQEVGERAGIDVSATALRRASEAASARKLLAHIDFQRHDLNETFPHGMFDLISAQYLHSPAHLDRETVLRRAAGQVNPGGVLLIVDHGAAPPWAQHDGHHFPGVAEVLASLRLHAPRWAPPRTETVDREMVGPNGEVGTMVDNVMVLRRAQ